MKRLLTFICFLHAMASLSAAPPNLNCEKVFDKSNLRKDGREIVIVKADNNYYRGLTSYNDAKLAAEVKMLVEKDIPRANNVSEIYRNGEERIIMTIPHNGYIINVGLTITETENFKLFIQGEPAAFK